MSGPEISDLQALINLLRNGGFEEWGVSAPTYWALAGAGATAVEETTVVYVGTAAALLTRVGADATLTQNVIGQTASLAGVQGKTFTLSVRVRKGAGVQASVGLDDGVGQFWSGYAVDADEFDLLSVTMTVNNNATKLSAILKLSNVDGSARFDAAMLTEGASIPLFAPNPADFFDPQIADPLAPAVPTGLTATAKMLAILLTWNSNDENDIDSYELQRADDAAFTVNTTIFRTYSTNLLDQVGDTTTRYYRLRAIRLSRATSAWSAGVAGTASAFSGATTSFSQTDRVLGRQSAGAGPGEEIPFTSAARALADDASAAAQRTTLGLGSTAVTNKTAGMVTPDVAAASAEIPWPSAPGISDIPYLLPGWDTTVYEVSRDAAVLAVGFGTAAPGGVPLRWTTIL